MRVGLDEALAAIDAANSVDPKSAFQGLRGTYWLHRLCDEPALAVEVAVRAHHLKRSAIPRATFPDGRLGYRRWRAAQKEALAVSLREALAGFDTDLVERVVSLGQRVGLGADADTQLVEDAACLVFCETDLVDLHARLGDDKTLDAVRKTVAKMSPLAVGLVGEATPPGPTRELLSRM